jgi:cysteinyl-tRNA synthetase
MHSEFLSIDGDKMSKSKGNVYTINKLKGMGFSAESIRYQLLSSHYRKKITFSIRKKDEVDRVISRFYNFYNLLISRQANLIKGVSYPQEYLEFCDKMNNDLNVSGALGIFFTWMKGVMKKIKAKNISDKGLGEAWMFLSVLNDVFDFIDVKKNDIPNDVRIILKKRMQAREVKDYVLSDLLRNELEIMGWKVEDSSQGQEVFKNK